MTVLVVCGPPRSSTTWMHNALIETGKYSGIKAIDTEFNNFSDENILFSDEDWYLTYYGMQAKHSLFHRYYFRKFSQRMDSYESKFLNNGCLLLESPYYVFLLDLFFERYNEDLQVVYMKRNFYDVASSMTRHPHLLSLLKKPFNQSFDFYSNWIFPVELGYADSSVSNYVKNKYNYLELIDRAIFKWHCFDYAFSTLARGSNFSYYEFNTSNPAVEDFKKLGSFCGLSGNSANRIASSFKAKRYTEPNVDAKLIEHLQLVK